MRLGELFAGYGGLGMGVQAAIGGDLAWYSEIEPAANVVMAHHHPGVPNLGDITTIDWAGVEPVDALTGGFPCQDLSHAGKGKGLRPGTRSGLWEHMAYAIDQLRPRLVVIENVRGLLSASAHCDVEPCPWCLGDDGDEHPLRALGAVLGDLADIGYDAEWVGVRAADVGAPHGRFRVFVAAHPDSIGGTRRLPRPTDDDRRDAAGGVEGGQPQPLDGERGGSGVSLWGPYAPAIARWERVTGRPAPGPTEPGRNGPRLSVRAVEFMMGLSDGWVTGVPGVTRNAALKLLGNGVVWQQAELALRILLGDAALPTLPTPAVNDMGAGKTVEDWDDWTDTMKAKHGNGNGHGKPLHIEAARLA